MTSSAMRAAIAVSCFALVAVSGARADIKDYAFELVEPAVPVGPEIVVAVKLVNRMTGKGVPEAVIFAHRLDMAPDGMAQMASKLTPVSVIEPGVYAFKANLAMEGRWQLSLAAKVQGETGTLESKLIIQAKP